MRNATAVVVGRRWPPIRWTPTNGKCENKYENRSFSPFTTIIYSPRLLGTYAIIIILCFTTSHFTAAAMVSCGRVGRESSWRAIHSSVRSFVSSLSVFPTFLHPSLVVFFSVWTYPFLHALYGSRTTDRPTWLENRYWCTSTIW